jgi:hypothetical protein
LKQFDSNIQFFVADSFKKAGQTKIADIFIENRHPAISRVFNRQLIFNHLNNGSYKFSERYNYSLIFSTIASYIFQREYY